mmetsp:Transcript_12441/g.17680  ORF Transcript_12441/g.17680 Transcript_12441/m.17680 type:complete len:83 (+) Transcript_12441:256-504(+)
MLGLFVGFGDPTPIVVGFEVVGSKDGGGIGVDGRILFVTGTGFTVGDGEESVDSKKSDKEGVGERVGNFVDEVLLNVVGVAL